MVDRHDIAVSRPRAANAIVSEVLAGLAAGGDPRHAIRDLNAEIIAVQGAGAELPAALIRLSSNITARYATVPVQLRRN
ncbi:MAG: hypothetical protein R3D67_02440 [Hyphomicrobiaceae bacterium]